MIDLVKKIDEENEFNEEEDEPFLYDEDFDDFVGDYVFSTVAKRT